MRRTSASYLMIAALAASGIAVAATRVPATKAREPADLREAPDANSRLVAKVPQGGALYVGIGRRSAKDWMYAIYTTDDRMIGGFMPVHSMGGAEIREIPQSLFDRLARRFPLSSTTGFQVDAKFLDGCRFKPDADRCEYRVSIKLRAPEEFSGYARAHCRFDFNFANRENRADRKRHSTDVGITIPVADGEGLALEFVTLDREFAKRYSKFVDSPPIACARIEAISLK